jgi:UDP-N-acetylglucosamine transferase subunit ALG13
VIFLTVGTQFAFDRLILTVDKWAKVNSSLRVFGQIGPGVHPLSMHFSESINLDEFDKKIEDAELVISHAGIGTIIKCWEKKTPLLVLPRKHELGEHRNDHQVDTCRLFRKFSFLKIARDELELLEFLENRKLLNFSFENKREEFFKLKAFLKESLDNFIG